VKSKKQKLNFVETANSFAVASFALDRNGAKKIEIDSDDDLDIDEKRQLLAASADTLSNLKTDKTRMFSPCRNTVRQKSRENSGTTRQRIKSSSRTTSPPINSPQPLSPIPKSSLKPLLLKVRNLERSVRAVPDHIEVTEEAPNVQVCSSVL
jgi:hypothetical protein